MKQLYVVGIGPGDYEKMTIEAAEVLDSCDVIVGYTVYARLVREHFPQKEYIVTGMKQEKQRCALALEAALQGKKVAVVCSGDAGVYGMAGILYEMSYSMSQPKKDKLIPGAGTAISESGVEILVIAGVTAALSGAAVLGAPLGHDFAVISLSDLLTPWEKIEQRLRCAAMSDLAICIYNPSSRKRKDYLARACRIISEFQLPETVCGYVRNIARDGESSRVLTLAELEQEQADMFTTVFIGNSRTKKLGEKMVTPRGYDFGTGVPL